MEAPVSTRRTIILVGRPFQKSERKEMVKTQTLNLKPVNVYNCVIAESSRMGQTASASMSSAK